MNGTIERPGSRLPNTSDSSRGVQIVKGVLALLATAFVVIGVPILLLAAFGNPLPDSAPTMEWLTRPASIETVMAVLAAVVWIAWAHFVICLVIEGIAEARRTMAPRVPGGGVGTQALARRLIVTIALLAGTTATTLGSASAAVAPATHDAGNQAQAGSYSAMQTPGATADQAAVAGAVQGVTQGLPGSNDLMGATSGDVAQGATTYYEVKPPEGRNYDTLWDISERYLGQGVRYKEIWELNKGLAQGDGRSLENADLIQPGWVLRMPSDAKGPGLKVVSHITEAPMGGDSATSASAAGGGAVADGGGVMADGSGGAGGAGGSGGSSAEAAPLVSENWTPFFGIAGGLALAGAFLGLRRRRTSMSTRQLWGRLTRTAGGPGPDGGPEGPGGPGGSLRTEAETGLAGFIDRAVRSLGSAHPAPVRAWAGGSGIALAFDEPQPAPPSPWVAAGDRTWTLAADAAPATDAPAALPGLVAAGRRDDGTVLLVDPESVAGILALTGDGIIGRGVATSMAVDTATHLWADDRAVTMVGFADDLTAVGQGALRRTDDLGRVLEALDNQARYQRTACRKAGVASVREGRITAPDLIDWEYHLVLCSGLPNAGDLARLAELAADPMVSLGVVVVGEVEQAAMALTVRPDGTLTAPLFGIEARAQVLTAKAARALASLYDVDDAGRQVTMAQLVERIDAEESAAPAAGTAVRIGVLGPVTVAAEGTVDEERRAFLTELAAFLALHPDGVHANLISGALWPRGVDAEVRDKALAQLGTWLGTTADGEPVLAEASGVWAFRPGAVAIDWDAFRATLNRAGDDPGNAETHLGQALGLVRGLPFADAPAGRYGWLESGQHLEMMDLAISLTALTLAERSAVRGDAEASRRTLQRGLELMPASEELWCSWLRLESQVGTRDDVRAVADRMYAALGQHGSPLGAAATTDALIDELLPGYRSRVA